MTSSTEGNPAFYRSQLTGGKTLHSVDLGKYNNVVDVNLINIFCDGKNKTNKLRIHHTHTHTGTQTYTHWLVGGVTKVRSCIGFRGSWLVGGAWYIWDTFRKSATGASESTHRSHRRYVSPCSRLTARRVLIRSETSLAALWAGFPWGYS